MCRMDLHATKPCLLRQLCCLGVVQRKLLNFIQRHPFTLQVRQVEFAWPFRTADWAIRKRTSMSKLQP